MKKIKLFGIFLLLFLIYSCEKETNKNNDVIDYNVPEMLSVLEKSGIDKSLIETKDSYFLVDGDIMIGFESIPEIKKAVDSKSKDSKLKAYHYPNPYYATINAVNTIKVYINQSVIDNGWNEAVVSAISEWNSIAVACPIHMSLVSSSSSANIIISTYYEVSNIVALGNVCINGAVGNNIKINTHSNGLSDLTKINTIAHEMGHTIGFAHSDGTSTFSLPLLILGTSAIDDPNAVMYPFTHDWHGFTSDEVLAATNLFPSIPISISGPTNITSGIIKPGTGYSYIVNFGSYGFSSCSWTIRYYANGDQNILPGTGSSITLYIKYESSIRDGINEVNYLEVYCPAINEYAWLAINIKDGYRLYSSSGPHIE